MVDLGHWLDGAYRIPAEEPPGEEESESKEENAETK